MSSTPEAPGATYPTGAPYHTGRGYTDTQVRAAERIFPTIKARQQRVLRLLIDAGAEGMTLQEAARILGGETGAWSSRFTELRDAGMIIDSGRRRRIRGHLPGIVWVLADQPTYRPPDAKPTARERIKVLEERIAELEEENRQLRRAAGKAPRQGSLF